MDDSKKEIRGIITELVAGSVYLLLTFIASVIILG
jgi:hypothetical protein